VFHTIIHLSPCGRGRLEEPGEGYLESRLKHCTPSVTPAEAGDQFIKSSSLLFDRGIQTYIVIPAEAGIHGSVCKIVDPCLRRDDSECVRVKDLDPVVKPRDDA